ncbi:MAG TPA: cell envelope integrity protein TolA [Telluria sp.]|nr:cell envelope integrity protein TolA [Telluria sp.]
MTFVTAGSHYKVPPEPSRWSAMGLAVAVHAGLLFFLWIGVQWQSTEPVAVEAEVWSVQTEMAGPPPPPPPRVEPQPEPRPEPEPTPTPKVEQPVAKTPPDIALEREKKRKEEQKKAEELAKQEKLEKQKQDQLEKEKLAKEKQAAKEKADKLAKAEADALKKSREAEMRRLSEAASGTGSAARSTAPKSDPGYIASLTAKIKGNIIYGGDRDVPGDPRAVYRIEQLPTGEIIGFKKIKSSGIPEYDRAVEQAITASSPLPKKKDGTVERSIEPIFKLKD